MKHVYRYIFFTLLLCSIVNYNILSAPKSGGAVAVSSSDSESTFTSAQLAKLAQERTTNLVIINDVQENNPNDLAYHMSSLNTGVMHGHLARALLSDQLVLCPKSLWTSVQNIASIFNDFATNIESTSKKSWWNSIRKTFSASEYKIYSEKCRLLKTIYDGINVKDATPEDIESYMQQMHGIFSNQNIDVQIRTNLKEMFSIYMYHESIIKQGYVCKQVTEETTDFDTAKNDFLLFVPTGLQNAKEDFAMQDALLGLSWSKLPDYAYAQKLSHVDNQAVMNAATHTNDVDTLGAKLVETLNVLTLRDSAISLESRPFFNYVIAGHGSADTVTAEISILPNKNKDGTTSASDYVQVLNAFQNNSRTLSATFISCYPAGKKFKDSYDINNFYRNVILEDIAYDLVTVGATYNPTVFPRVSAGLGIEVKPHFSSSDLYVPPMPDQIASYLQILEKSPESPDYLQAAKFLSEGMQAFSVSEGKKSVDAMVIETPQNYASIKPRNAPFFVVLQDLEHDKQFSQIAVSTADKPLMIEDSVKNFILNANYIPQQLQFQTYDVNNLPKFIPANYVNQNYYFKSVVMDELHNSWQNIFRRIFVSKIEEPINIVLKELVLPTGTLSNVCIFMHKSINFFGKPQSGYTYTNAQGETKIASWASDEDIPELIEETIFKGDLASLTDSIAIKAQEGKSQAEFMKALQPEFISELSSKLDAKKYQELAVDQKSDWVKDPVTGKWTSTKVTDETLAQGVEALRAAQAAEAKKLAQTIREKKPTSSKETLAQQIEDERMADHNSKGFLDGIKNIRLYRNSDNITNDKKVSFTEWLRGQADRRAVENRMKQLPSGDESGEGAI